MNFDEVLNIANKFAKLVLEKLEPKFIILYGSYSKFSAKDNSDIDIAFIFDKPVDKFYDQWRWIFLLTKIPKFRLIEPNLLNLHKDASGFAKYIL
jgi:predicted nucleotidyltransferase